MKRAGAKAFDIDTSVKSDSSGPKSAPLPTSRHSFHLGLNPTRVVTKTFNETVSSAIPIENAMDNAIDNTINSAGNNASPVFLNTDRCSSSPSGSSPQVELEQPGLAGKSLLLSASMSDALASEISVTDVSDIPSLTD